MLAYEEMTPDLIRKYFPKLKIMTAESHGCFFAKPIFPREWDENLKIMTAESHGWFLSPSLFF